MFDITKEAVSDTAAIHVKGAGGNPLYSDGKPVRIVLYGPSTPQYAEIEARQTSRALARAQANDGKPSIAPPEQARANAAEDLAALTVEFENLSYPPAGDVKGFELFRALYSDPKLGFIVNQVNKSINDWSLFRQGSAPN